MSEAEKDELSMVLGNVMAELLDLDPAPRNPER